jgi:hypothetical protein
MPTKASRRRPLLFVALKLLLHVGVVKWRQAPSVLAAETRADFAIVVA